MPSSSDPAAPHDALFKWTFSQIEHAQAELRSILPASVLRHVDLTTLELCPGEFVDATLTTSHSDLLYRVQLAERPGLLYILFEHQSSGDALMPLRLLGYLVRILELEARTCVSERRPVVPLPVVLPVVLHHSEQGWQRALRFENLFDPALLAEPELAELVPRFGFVLEDLSQVTDGHFENAPSTR